MRTWDELSTDEKLQAKMFLDQLSDANMVRWHQTFVVSGQDNWADIAFAGWCMAQHANEKLIAAFEE